MRNMDIVENDLFYTPEDGFWSTLDRVSFEANNLRTEWPECENPFVKRMATNIQIGRRLPNLCVDSFAQLIGELVRQDPTRVYRFVVMPNDGNPLRLSVVLRDRARLSLSPILSDNTCAFSHAIHWMAEREQFFEVSCTCDASFWVHKKC